ncbi:MAG TPA: SpoIIE family protein phosphatase [Actinomycetales bacterium]|nr:SpoIIE family protein phosphatase [Actinomycetales bacterium]
MQDQFEHGVEELPLADSPDAVPTARRFTVATLNDRGWTDVVDDAAMVVTELITNALLYGGAPVVLRLVPILQGLRIEVQDHGEQLPMRVVSTSESMTGRGLAVVGTLSNRWGVEPLPDGKVVWCELSVDGDAQPGDGWAASAPPRHTTRLGDERFTVYLGDAPTQLLLESKAHVDNMVRELMLMSVGAEAGHHAPLPERLRKLVESVVTDFAEARNAIRRQAVQAAEAGQERTELWLTLPYPAIVSAQSYLAALTEADAYARAGHMLTLETPAGHRVFRSWYIENLVERLTAAHEQRPEPPLQTFESRLIRELDELDHLRRAAQRSARLQPVTAALAGATTEQEVARIVVEEAVSAMGATAASVMTRDPETGLLHVPGQVGFPADFHSNLTQQQLEEHGPASEALRTGEAVWVRSSQEAAHYPVIQRLEPGTSAVCGIPLKVAGHVVGALRLSFEAPQLFEVDDRTFLLALAAQASQALERTALHRAERRARAAAEELASRLERLQAVTGQMAAAAHLEQVVDIIVVNLGDALGAAITSLSLLDGEELRLVKIRGGGLDESHVWPSRRIDSDLPASEAIRSGRPVVVPRHELHDRYPLLGRTGGEGMGPLVCLPLQVRQRTVGAVTLTYPAGATLPDAAELAFLEALAKTCAQAIDRTEALSQAREATERLAVLAEASAELAEAHGYRETLSSIARLIVPRLADWCAITVEENGVLQPVTIAHVDADKVRWAKELQESMPPDPNSSVGPAAVIRSGESQLYPEVTDELVDASDLPEDRKQIVRQMGISSTMTVPLTGRSGTFGALQLVYAGSGRRYTYADLAMMEDLGRRAGVAVENARAFETQKAQLASISRVAEVAQHAILAPVPPHCGPVRLAGAYVSASKDALIGGDLYEVVSRGESTRLLIGDVRGKGLDAVRLATVVLGLFRTAAADHDDLNEIARQIDRRLRPYLGDEDFVTALLVNIEPDGATTFANCGHPSPLLARDGALSSIACPPTLPLGLGAEPDSLELRMKPGDRLLLYTDGLIESRDPSTGEFLHLEEVAAPLASGELATVLGNVLARVQKVVGQQMADDLAMLVVEYEG